MNSYFQFEDVNNRFSAKVLFPVLFTFVSDSESYFAVSGLLHGVCLPRTFNTYINNISVSQKSSLYLMTSSVLRARAKHEQITVELCDVFSSPNFWIRKGISLLAGTTYGMNITYSTAGNLRVKVTMYRPVQQNRSSKSPISKALIRNSFWIRSCSRLWYNESITTFSYPLF